MRAYVSYVELNLIGYSKGREGDVVFLAADAFMVKRKNGEINTTSMHNCLVNSLGFNKLAVVLTVTDLNQGIIQSI